MVKFILLIKNAIFLKLCDIMSYCIICKNFQNMKCIMKQGMKGLNSYDKKCLYFKKRENDNK